MIVSKLSNWLCFRTSFNDEYDIIHQYVNLDGCPVSRNDHVDYLSSCLAPKDHTDMWNAPIVLSTSSDEDPPVIINGAWIGGGHGHPGAVTVYAPNHGKTLKDVGAVYVDGKGMKFTLFRIFNSDYLGIISQNIGESVCKYKFDMDVKDKLTYLLSGDSTSDIAPIEQTPRMYLYSANRMLDKKIVVHKDGKARTTLGSAECDFGEIHEHYQIINPATVAPVLTAERPDNGYKHTPDMSLIGEPMLDLDYVMRVDPDGAMMIEFDVKKLMDVDFSRFMGMMYQEKKDVYGGGIHRFLSHVKPFELNGKVYDFSTPLALRGGDYPDAYEPNVGDFDNPDTPFDRIVDYFRDKDGNDKLGFACGFLPVYDGVPEIRKKHLDKAILIYKTRKAYPYFANGNNVGSFKGVAYKKFFDVKDKNKASVYDITFKGKKYIYFDIFEENTLTFDVKGSVTPFDITGDISYEIKDGKITVSATKGHAVFIEDLK